MVKFFRVKEKARGLARQQKFDEALAEYRAAIKRADADRDLVALRNLYNAAGDASLQKNDSARAVEYFEKAADSYLEEGLHDNAIALCHKILRHVPTKVEVYARLGRIYGEKGLRNEGIQNWLEYAERREKAGDLAGVTLALREVLGLSPDSDVVRQQLVEVLLVQGDARGALPQLEELHRRAQAAADAERVVELAQRLEALRADAEAQAAAEAARAPAPAETPELELRPEEAGAAAAPSFGEAAPELEADPFERLPELGDSRGAGQSVPASSERVSGLDPGFGFSVEGAGLEPPAAPVGEPAAAHAADGRDGAAARAARDFDSPRDGLWTLPGFTPPEGPALEPPPPLPPVAPIAQEPPLEIGRVPFVAVEERIARAEARLSANPADAEERVYLSELYQEAGALDLARAAAEQAGAELLQGGHAEAAYRAYRRVVALVPDEIEAVQKLVDVAQTTGRRDALIESCELLGNRLMAIGQYDRAREVHHRILDLEPGHGASQDQLLILEGLGGSLGAATADKGPVEEADRRDAVEYVDLATLIQEGEADRTADPRMRSAAQPTGDEQADLQAIIEAFRRGVAENIDERDFESHYDLGVAFRDMGLLDEAIREFQLAARGRDRRERAFEMMGLCFMEKGMPSVAVNCFRRGIESGGDAHESLGLHYHLGRSLEELGDASGAREEYAKVVALDVQFLDAAERLQRLA